MDPTKVPINHVPASHPRKIPDLLRGRCSNAPKLGLQFLLTVGERQRAGNVTIASAAMVGYAYDYATDHDTGWHKHPRAQLLHAISGIMRVATATALFIVPPGTGLWVPAHTEHVTRMPSGLAMRGLFLREDAARAGPDRVTVVAISPLLRALILAACEQPVMWDEDGPVRHVVALALHEIGHAATRPISVPASNDARLRRVTETLLANPADSRGLDAFAEMAGASTRTLARLFRRETGMSSFRHGGDSCG